MLALYPSLIFITTLSLSISIKKYGLFSPLAITSLLIAYTIYGFSAYKMTFAHEAAHNAFKNKRLNQVVGNYSCVFLFVSFGAYACSHLRHHSSMSVEEDLIEAIIPGMRGRLAFQRFLEQIYKVLGNGF